MRKTILLVLMLMSLAGNILSISEYIHEKDGIIIGGENELQIVRRIDQ